MSEQVLKELAAHVRAVPDFPAPGTPDRPALADAEIALIGELAVAIANSLAEVGKDSPSASAN